MNHREQPSETDRVDDDADNSTDRCLEGATDQPSESDLAWAKEALAPFRDIPLTPEQERALVLWTQGPQPAVARCPIRRDRASNL